MASLQETASTILIVGNALAINKRFIVGANAIWFYDYFLTLSDEIECAWSRRNSANFVLFIANRYWPLLYLTWLSVSFWSPKYTKSMCDKTAWLHVFYFTLATLFSQIAITLRVYAVTGNSRWICTCLSFMTLVQFSFGMYFAIRLSLQPSAELPDLPLDVFELCISNRWRPGEITNTVLSLVYDAVAFSIIVYSMKWRGVTRAHGVPSLLDKIVRDATVYFVVIFTSHLLLLLFEFFAPEPIQLVPASGNAVLVPVMITRLMLSLKRAARSPDLSWSFSDAFQPENLRFANYSIGGSELGGGRVALGALPLGEMCSPPEP